MHNLFEPGDLLNSPYEAFVFDTTLHLFPVRQHWHHYMEILLVTKGSITVKCNNEEFTANVGDMVSIPPKCMHSIYFKPSQTHAIYQVLKFDLNRFHENVGYTLQLKSAILQAQENHHTSNYFSHETLMTYPVKDYVLKCLQEYEQKDYGYYPAIHSYLANILIFMLRIWRNNGFVPSHETTLLPDNSIEAIIEYIDDNSDQPLKVEKLAAKCNMSYSFFAKKFKQLYGRSCKEYIEYIRVTKAEDLLLFTDFDLSYISQATGFSDCSHMIKTFKKYKDITPKQFRLQNTKALH